MWIIHPRCLGRFVWEGLPGRVHHHQRQRNMAVQKPEAFAHKKSDRLAHEKSDLGADGIAHSHANRLPHKRSYCPPPLFVLRLRPTLSPTESPTKKSDLGADRITHSHTDRRTNKRAISIPDWSTIHVSHCAADHGCFSFAVETTK